MKSIFICKKDSFLPSRIFCTCIFDSYICRQLHLIILWPQTSWTRPSYGTQPSKMTIPDLQI